MNSKVTIIGGGPAGATAATMLAKQGVFVDLFEKSYFPREHIGESLLPASLPIIKELGLENEIANAGFLKKYGATMVWGEESKPWSWYFSETNKTNPHSYQVSRDVFDQILLNNAKSHGVNVYEGHNIRKANIVEGAITELVIDGPTESYCHKVSHLIDASGQTCLLGNTLKNRQWDESFRNLSVYSYFSGVSYLPEPDTNNIFIESYPGGWIWIIPISKTLASVGIVVDSTKAQNELNITGIQNYFDQQLNLSNKVKTMLSQAKMTKAPTVIKDWSYKCDKLFGENYVQVGDAACFIDPLFSSGVHMAMMSGVLSASYMATIIDNPESFHPVGESYQELYFKEYNHFREMAQLFYSSNMLNDSYFWSARKNLPEFAHYSPRHAFIRAVAGQPPHGYERAVLTKGAMPSSFVASVKEVEDSRKERMEYLSQFKLAETNELSDFWEKIPVLNNKVEIVNKYILGTGKFVESTCILTESNPEGIPCSTFVKEIIDHINGTSNVRSISNYILSKQPTGNKSSLLQNIYNTICILYADEIIIQLKNPSSGLNKKIRYIRDMTNDGMDHLIIRE